MREINQTNLVRMVGACLKSDVKFLLNEFCSKGSLQVSHCVVNVGHTVIYK